MNNLFPDQPQGYAETWLAYTKTEHYIEAVKLLTQKGCTNICVDEILEHAFNAGWNLLISTFIKNITDNEKRFRKPVKKLKKVKP